MTNLKHLRGLCDAATDGEWFTPTPASPTPYVTDGISEFDICDLYHKADDGKIYTKENAEANARFIAATDPQTVIGLIDEIEKLQRDLEIADYAFDLCHRYNGNSKCDYFSQAEQALKGDDDA